MDINDEAVKATGISVAVGQPPTRHDDSILSVGWEAHDNQDNIVDDLDNQDLWLLLRRFNKHVYHIKATTRPMLPGDLDFSTAPGEDFSANKLRAQLERLYIGIVVGVLGFLQHVARLRSWSEPRRTLLFFMAYYTSWCLQLVIPAAFAALAALIVSPRLRRLMFPPAPRSMVSIATGEIQPPASGILATADSVMGAPEVHKGEALENEAGNFAASVIGIAAAIVNDIVEPQDGDRDDDNHDEALAHHYFHSDEAALRAAAATTTNGPYGMKASSVAQEGGEPGGGAGNAHKHIHKPSMPGPHDLALKVAVAKDKAEGVDQPSRDRSKIPIQKMVWRGTRAVMHGLGQLADYWERCANLVDPKPPFVKKTGQYRLASGLAAISLLTTFVSLHTMSRIFAFFVGALFFGRPLLGLIQHEMITDNAFLRRTLFHGVPTDAQQTIAILRLGEAARAPIPPPPPSFLTSNRSGSSSSLSEQQRLAIEKDPEYLDASFGDQPLGTSPSALQHAARTDQTKLQANSPHDHVLQDPESHGRVVSKLFGAAKLGVRAAARVAVAADAVRAKIPLTGSRSRSARMRLGAADGDDDDGDEDDKGDDVAGGNSAVLAPVEFKARYDGKKGFLYLTTADDGGEGGPSLCFTRSRGVTVPAMTPEDSDDTTDSEHDQKMDIASGAPAAGSASVTKTHADSLQAIGTPQPVWAVPVDEIAELNKFSGYGGKAKVLAGWALDTPVKNGLQIIDRHGTVRLVTAVPRRDELFNRLCAMGGQRWEVW
ncbi:DUF3292 domain-containing protein [Microdochium nivale]|nr:DUF3292 domain-containing protein [Microdochium nivale]